MSVDSCWRASLKVNKLARVYLELRALEHAHYELEPISNDNLIRDRSVSICTSFLRVHSLQADLLYA